MVNNYSFPNQGPVDQFSTRSQTNIDILSGIAAGRTGPEIAPEKAERLVYQAAIQVLSNIQPYLMGAEVLNGKQIRQIANKFKKLHETAHAATQKEMTHLAKKGNLLMKLISSLRDRPIQNRDDLNQLLPDYYQIMGCVVAYKNWKKGDIIPGPNPELPNYQVHEVIKNAKGLQILVLTPIGNLPAGFPPMPPIVCCRGTVGSNPHNIIDDMEKYIGQYSFQDSKNAIADALKEVSEAYGPAVLTGHSLGGALVQTIVAEYCDHTNNLGGPFIQSAYHFNAPGVGQRVVRKYREKRQQLPEDRKPKVFSYHHASDIVSLAGGSHLRADERYEIGKYALMMSVKASHSFNKLISEIGIKKVTTRFSVKRKFMKYVGEKVRVIVSFIVKWFFVGKVKKQQKHTTSVKTMLTFTKATSHERNRQIAAYQQEQERQRVAKAKAFYQIKPFA